MVAESSPEDSFCPVVNNWSEMRFPMVDVNFTPQATTDPKIVYQYSPNFVTRAHPEKIKLWPLFIRSSKCLGCEFGWERMQRVIREFYPWVVPATATFVSTDELEAIRQGNKADKDGGRRYEKVLDQLTLRTYLRTPQRDTERCIQHVQLIFFPTDCDPSLHRLDGKALGDSNSILTSSFQIEAHLELSTKGRRISLVDGDVGSRAETPCVRMA